MCVYVRVCLYTLTSKDRGTRLPLTFPFSHLAAATSSVLPEKITKYMYVHCSFARQGARARQRRDFGATRRLGRLCQLFNSRGKGGRGLCMLGGRTAETFTIYIGLPLRSCENVLRGGLAYYSDTYCGFLGKRYTW